MLSPSFSGLEFEAGCDEAGRGCLAGPVFAAAVIFERDYTNPDIDDSKKLNKLKRKQLAETICRDAVSWSVASVGVAEIDQINILQASIKAMNQAVEKLNLTPDFLIVDGNRFNASLKIPFQCIIGGDSKFLSIAAASILAKHYRDVHMKQLGAEMPQYFWSSNKGYPTIAHKQAIAAFGLTNHHRHTFNWKL